MYRFFRVIETRIIYKIAKAAKVEILNVSSHKFEPQGFTLVALLSESHFSFHTFPERGVISFDFFTCGKVNPKVALKILRNEIDHKRVVTNAFDRSSIGLYDDIYSTPGQKKFYVVKDVLEKFKVSPKEKELAVDFTKRIKYEQLLQYKYNKSTNDCF